MRSHEVVNRLQSIFGRAVWIVDITPRSVRFTVDQWHREFSAEQQFGRWQIFEVIEGDVSDETEFSRWVQGMFDGQRRNEAGEMVG